MSSVQIALVVYPGMTALDIVGPYEVLRFIPGAELRFVWTEPGPVTTDSGVLVLGATHSFDETPAPDIIVIGGSGSVSGTISKNEQLLQWLRQAHTTSQWTASVCTGSIVLASAGLLDGKPATTHWAELPILETLGARAVHGERIVHVGKIVTGAGVSAGIDVALWLVGKVAGDSVAQAAQLLIEYDPRPPYDSGSLAAASAATKRSATAIIGREAVKLAVHQPVALAQEANVLSQFAWRSALAAARRRTGRARWDLTRGRLRLPSGQRGHRD